MTATTGLGVSAAEVRVAPCSLVPTSHDLLLVSGVQQGQQSAAPLPVTAALTHHLGLFLITISAAVVAGVVVPVATFAVMPMMPLLALLLLLLLLVLLRTMSCIGFRNNHTCYGRGGGGGQGVAGGAHYCLTVRVRPVVPMVGCTCGSRAIVHSETTGENKLIFFSHTNSPKDRLMLARIVSQHTDLQLMINLGF